MTTEFRVKQTSEEWAIGFDFTEALNGAIITSITSIIALDQLDGSNVSTIVLNSAKQFKDDSVAYGWVRAGTSGHRYLITCIILASDGSIYELEGILPVLDVPSAGAVGTGGTRLVVEPAIEPVSLAELKVALNIDSGTIPSDMTPYTSLPSTNYPIDLELLTLDVAPATPWVVGNIITGQTSSKTCIIVTVITTKTFIVKSRSGAYTLGEIVGVTGVAGKLADQGAAFPTFSTTYNNGFLALGTPIDVLGHTSVVYLTPVNNGAGGTVDVKIQESDILAGPYTDFSTGAFTRVTESNDTTIQEISYTGAKKFIRTVAKVLVSACEFGTSVMVWKPNVSDDDFLNELIETARRDVEHDTSRVFITQTWDYCPKSWPRGDRIKLPFGSLQSITSISYTDIAGTVSMMPTTDYTTEINGNQCGFAVLAYGKSWPSVSLHPSNPITIRFVAGYGATAASVPVTVRQAIKRRCVNLYANRGDDVVGQTVSEDRTYRNLVNNVGRLFDMDFDF